MDRELKKGLLDICVLKCLSLNDSYGYKIIDDLKDIIEISESTLYPILKRLELNNSLETYSEEHNSRLRKYYRITEFGKNRIDEFKNEWDRVQKVYDYIMKGENNE